MYSQCHEGKILNFVHNMTLKVLLIQTLLPQHTSHLMTAAFLLHSVFTSHYTSLRFFAVNGLLRVLSNLRPFVQAILFPCLPWLFSVMSSITSFRTPHQRGLLQLYQKLLLTLIWVPLCDFSPLASTLFLLLQAGRSGRGICVFHPVL